MRKKSVNKYLKKLKKREATKLAGHLEKMGAAFCKDVGISPKDVVLVSKVRDDGTHEYRFERQTEKVNMAELHPDIRTCFEAAYRKTWGPPLSDEEERTLREVMEKYKKEFDGELK